jgi:nitrate/nitrite transporter NarK
MISRGASPTTVRKAFTGGALAANGIMLGLCSFTGPRVSVAIILCSMVFFGSTASNQFAIPQRLAGPVAIGSWLGFQNAFGNLAGIVAPIVTGFVVGRTGHFNYAFPVLTVVALFGTAVLYLLMGPVEAVASLSPATGRAAGG